MTTPIALTDDELSGRTLVSLARAAAWLGRSRASGPYATLRWTDGGERRSESSSASRSPRRRSASVGVT